MQAEAFSSFTQWSTIPVNAIKKLLVSLEISISHGGFNHLAKLTFGKNTFIVFFIWYLIPPREISGGVFEPSREYHFHKDPPFKLILISFIQINKISVWYWQLTGFRMLGASNFQNGSPYGLQLMTSLTWPNMYYSHCHSLINRVHSITTWTRRGEWWVSGKSMVG